MPSVGWFLQKFSKHILALWCHQNILVCLSTEQPDAATAPQPMAYVWGGATCLTDQWQMGSV